MQTRDEVQLRVRRYMEALDARGYFYGTVLVACRGEVLISEGYGVAQAEHDVPHTRATKFRIGSITKSFTAAAVLLLAEEGRLRLDDPIVEYLPEYPNGERITVRHLLTHTSGIANFTSSPDYWPTVMRLPHTREQLLARFRDEPLQFSPGERFSYNNSGYVLLTLLIERVAGCSYADLLTSRILEPLGLVNTGYDDGKTVHKHLASGYSVWKRLIRAEPIDMSVPLGAYGMYATAEDLHKWMKALTQAELLSPASVESMFTPYRDNYGLGWAIQRKEMGGRMRTIVSHFGDINGFVCDVLHVLKDDVTVVVLSNVSLTPVTKISRELAALVFDEEVRVPERISPLAVSHDECLRFAGTYRANQGGAALDIIAEEDGLYLRVAKRYGVPYCYRLIPVARETGAVRFVTEWVDEQVTIRCGDENGTAELTYVDVDGQRVDAQKA